MFDPKDPAAGRASEPGPDRTSGSHSGLGAEPSRRLDLTRLLWLSLLLSLLGGSWLSYLRTVIRGIPGDNPLLLQIVLDGLVGLPFVALAVIAGSAGGRRAAARFGLLAAGRQLLPATCTAVLAALALAITGPLEQQIVSPMSSGPLLGHLMRDGLLVLPLTLLGALLACLAASRHDRVRRASASAVPRRRLRGTLAQLTGSAVLLSSLGIPLLATPAHATVTDPGNPCPTGSPQRTFAVTAINVRIPLNRFGDNDPAGKMMVATSSGLDGPATPNLLTAPGSTPTDALAAVRQQEASQKVSIGLRDDPIQPLSIRANEGDCVTISFTNNASGGSFGLHIDGIAFAAASSGDAIGRNADSSTPQGGMSTFRYYIPDNPNLEGSHYIHPGPGFRSAVNHGMFGMLNVEPKGSTYWDASIPNQPLVSGWEAVISRPVNTLQPGRDKSFREGILQHHEVGNDNERVYDRTGLELPQVDSLTGSYRPGEFALNYRSEPFRNRLLAHGQEKSHSYSSYTFGDPSTPMPRGYVGDPTKFRISHASGEKFHVYHLHGGGDRWRLNPLADPSWNYSDTLLNKHPQNEVASNRLDAQSIGPGESYNLELEGGAGGVQHTVGDLLFHCHIAKHYVSGMWSFWRVYNTKQPDFVTLQDQAWQPPEPVTSDLLLGRTFGSQTLATHADVDAWVRQQLPPQGVRNNPQDPSVMDWKFAKNNPNLVLGEPEDTTPQGTGPGQWPNQSDVAGQPGLLSADAPFLTQSTDAQHAEATPTATIFPTLRPVMLFNPQDGRPAFPTLRTHLGYRPPFSPNGHSGSPFLGEHGDAAPGGQHSTTMDPKPIASSFPTSFDPAHPSTVDPYAQRADGLCPRTQAPDPRNPSAPPLPTVVRHFNIVAIPTRVTRSKSFTDKEGKLFTLAQDKAKVYADPNSQPLALRVNVGDCAKVTLTNEIPDTSTFDGWSKTTIHIHHVQFDVQGSDGVSTGYAYEHSVRPYGVEDTQLTPLPAGAPALGPNTIHVGSVAKFLDKTADGDEAHPFIGVGMGTEGIEVRQVMHADTATSTIELDAPLTKPHPMGEAVGFEFIQYEWFADTQLDNIFWHDHVDGIHGWGHGLVGQLIVEPAGSKYYAPNNHSTEIASGTIADIVVDPNSRNYQPLLPGTVNGSFREMALWTIDDNDRGDYSTLNLKAAPFTERPNAATRYSSYANGDPMTPLPRAYPGDPVVVRTINVGPTLDTLRFTGQRFAIDTRMTLDNLGNIQGDPGSSNPAAVGSLLDTIHYGMSEKYTLALGGAGASGRSRPGDYLYYNAVARRTAQGAWGIIRVLPNSSPDLLPLPDNPAPGGTWTPPSGSVPPTVATPSNPCPSGASLHSFAISAIDMPDRSRALFVATARVADVLAGTAKIEPLVLHVAEGECVKVHLTNDRTTAESFAVGKLDRNSDSSGVDVGYSPENNTPAGGTRDYWYYADTDRIGSATISDMAGDSGKDSQKAGLYGAIVVAARGATFSSDIGARVDVHVPATATAPRHDYRDFSLLLADNDAQMSQDFMPYPTNAVQGQTNINYQTAPAGDSTSTYATGNNDPTTPVIWSYVGDEVVVHEMVAPGSEQGHVFSLGGLDSPRDVYVPHSEYAANQALGPGESYDAWISGYAGGWSHTTGDYWYGDLRRPFTQVGAWGLQRVLPSPSNCASLPAGVPSCLVMTTGTTPTPSPSSSGSGGSGTATAPAPAPSSSSGTGTGTAPAPVPVPSSTSGSGTTTASTSGSGTTTPSTSGSGTTTASISGSGSGAVSSSSGSLAGPISAEVPIAAAPATVLTPDVVAVPDVVPPFAPLFGPVRTPGSEASPTPAQVAPAGRATATAPRHRTVTRTHRPPPKRRVLPKRRPVRFVAHPRLAR